MAALIWLLLHSNPKSTLALSFNAVLNWEVFKFDRDNLKFDQISILNHVLFSSNQVLTLSF